jgi:hypothetical protein
MNRKILIGFLVFMIIGLIIFMVKDLYFSKKIQDNPYEIKTGSLKKYNTALVSHKEIFHINTGMSELNSIVIDDSDNIIIAGNKVKMYDKNFNEIKSFNLPNPANSMALGKDGKIYLGIMNHIEIWNKKGELINRWKTKNKESIFTSLAVNENSVFIADAGERVLHRCDLSGKFINNIGGEDSLKDIPEIIIRSAFFKVAFGRDNEIWINNPGKYLLEAFDIKGNLISSWGDYSDSIDGFCGCCNPTNFIVLDDGSFVTSEKAFPRVKIYSPEGKFVSVVAGNEKFDEGTKGLDLAIDSKKRIYVLDPARKQIRIFEKNL